MCAERTENVNPKVTPMASQDADDGKYQRSTIEFPYNDLESAVEIAKAIASNAGVSCTVEQLAAYLRKAVSGPFRVLVSGARMFGITKNEKGQVHLTELGRMVADPKTEAAARVEAFLSVELYKAIFEKYRRFTLPGSKGLETEIQSLGVSSKQADKARQTFMRSAKQAGFFAHGEDRLVKPSLGPLPLTKPIKAQEDGETSDETKDDAGGGGGGGTPPIDPIIRGLLARLPKSGGIWPEAERKLWLQLLEGSFKLIYKEAPESGYRGYEIQITSKPPGWQAAIYPTRPNLPKIDWELEPINEMTEAAAREKAWRRIDENRHAPNDPRREAAANEDAYNKKWTEDPDEK
jgi:hypothetical protein